MGFICSVLSYCCFFACLTFGLTNTFRPAFTRPEPPCTCDFADITGSCVCTDEHNVTVLTDLFNRYAALLCSSRTRPIHAVHFSRLPKLHSVCSGHSSLNSNCSVDYLTNLSLSSTAIVQLDNNSFTDFPNLVWLNFSNNPQLNTYGDGAFTPIGEHLTTLIAQNNPVRSLTRDVFHGLRVLQKLSLSDNKIGYIEAGVFSRNCCSELRELRLDNNILTVLDSDTLLGLMQLEVLDLRNNPLQQIDPSAFIHAASTLTELYMSHSDSTPFGGFESPHPGLFDQLSRLTVLQMDELKIKNLTAANFRSLHNLRTLSLRGNRLLQLPADVFSSLSRLERLDLSANWLVCFTSALNPSVQSDFLAGLPLKWIDLSWNRLTHLNQLTIRSLGLFEPRFLDRTRVILNLTANPWQHIDDDAFCGPPANPVIRPIDLIIGPTTSAPFGAWRTSLGLWVARAQWPNGPLATIGPQSRIFGLMLSDPTTERLITLADDEAGLVQLGVAFVGANDTEQRCQQLQMNKQSTMASNESDDIPLELNEIKRPSAISIAYSLASYCPRLPIHKLDDWELNHLKVTDLIDSYDLLAKSPLRTVERGSRLYLLIIVGVCITFLLIALTVIMCYRAWSRRTSQKCAGNDFEGCPTALTLEGPSEKHLLLRHQALSHNNNNNHRNVSNNMKDKYQENCSNFSGQHHSPPLSTEATGMKTDIPNGAVSLVTNSHSTSPNTTESQLPIEPMVPIPRSHLRSGRPKSDSDANELDPSHKLTAFGVV